MKEIKDTIRSRVRIAYDGLVHKTFHGSHAPERFATEVRVLRYLESRDCPFVPRLIEADTAQLRIVTSNCGQPVERLSENKARSLFEELEQYGVRHHDPFVRNITYDSRRSRFCIIDFELAEILDPAAEAVARPEAAPREPAIAPDPPPSS